MEVTKSILENLVNTVNGQLNESYILDYNYIDLYSMYKIVNGFVDNDMLGMRRCMTGNEMYYYLTGIISANKVNKVGYTLFDWYIIDYNGSPVKVELIEICSDYYRFRDNILQGYSIPFTMKHLISR